MPGNDAPLPAVKPAVHIPPALPGAQTALALLIAINLFNYIDRQVLAAVEPEIRREFLKDDDEATAKVKMGLLAYGFLVTYMIVAPLFGRLADRYSRWYLIGIGVSVWSLASGASGVDWGLSLGIAFWILFLTRCFVGIGEGGYGPVAPTMLSDYYPVQRRGQILAWFYLAIPVGGALGYAFGELMHRNFGWRSAFYAVVAPGLVLGLLCFFMREPARGAADVPADSETPPPSPPTVAGPETPPPPQTSSTSAWQKYWNLMKIPSFTLNTFGMTAMTFAIGALAWWMPDYLDEKRVEDLAGIGPRTVFGIITASAGLLGTLAGGWAGDALKPRIPGSYFLVSGVALILGCPLLLCFLVTPFPLAWVFAFLAVFCLFFNTGPGNTILANVTHPSVRASGFALNILIIHLFGDAISPLIIGYIAGVTSNDIAFSVVAVFMRLGRIIWLCGMRYLARDTALATTRPV